jgi:membrane protease YdiL (CAAX protease family)
MGLPAVLLTLWIAIRRSGSDFTDYLALRRTSFRDVLIGLGGMVVVVLGWSLLSRLTGREATSDVMSEVLQSARSAGGLWLMSLAFCVAAPATEELLVRGFLYRGWSETRLGPPGAIALSSLLWTALHLQYGWFLLGEVFCIGLWLGYMRYRSASIWLTILLHGFNNSSAMVVTIWLGQG